MWRVRFVAIRRVRWAHGTQRGEGSCARCVRTMRIIFFYFFLVKPSSYSRTTYTDGRGDDGKTPRRGREGLRAQPRHAPRASNARGHRPRRRAQKPSPSVAQRAGREERVLVEGYPGGPHSSRVHVDAPGCAAQGAPAVRRTLYVGIAAAADRVRAVPAAWRRTRVQVKSSQVRLPSRQSAHKAYVRVAF